MFSIESEKWFLHILHAVWCNLRLRQIPTHFLPGGGAFVFEVGYPMIVVKNFMWLGLFFRTRQCKRMIHRLGVQKRAKLVKKGTHVFGHSDKFWKGHEGQIKKNACKNAYFTRMIWWYPAWNTTAPPQIFCWCCDNIKYFCFCLFVCLFVFFFGNLGWMERIFMGNYHFFQQFRP